MRTGILREHSSLLNVALHVLDWSVVALSSVVAYWIYLGEPILPGNYLLAIIVAVLITAIVFPRLGLYRAWRGGSIFEEVQ